MDKKNSYKSASPYEAYCKKTNEKAMLHQSIAFSIKNPHSILDLGCGNGVNTSFLANQFPTVSIVGIERSAAQISYAKQHNSNENVEYINISFEDYAPGKKFDFILVSHVLQYIDTNLRSFVEQAISLLAPNGEIWFVQQTREGLAQIIEHQKPLLANPRFKDWKTFEDYEEILKNCAKNCTVKIKSLNSSIRQIDFKNPSAEDKLRLEFIFCLEEGNFDRQTDEFKSYLAKLQLGQGGRISHPNRILIIKK